MIDPSSAGDDEIEATPESVAAAMVAGQRGRNAEQCAALEDELRQRFSEERPLKRGDVTLEQAAARLAEAKTRPRSYRMLIATVLVLLVILGGAAVQIPKLRTWAYFQELMYTPTGPASPTWMWIPGSPWQPPNEWQANQDTPAAYMAYAMSRAAVPDDYDATWQRLDPDNAAWLMLKSRLILSSRDSRLPATREDAIQALRDAAQMTRCDSYGLERNRIKRYCFRQPQNSPETRIVESRLFSWNETILPGWQFLVGQVTELKKAGKSEEAKELSAVIRRCLAMEVRGRIAAGDMSWDSALSQFVSNYGQRPMPPDGLDGVDYYTVREMSGLRVEQQKAVGDRALLETSIGIRGKSSRLFPSRFIDRLRLPFSRLLLSELCYNAQFVTAALSLLTWLAAGALWLRQRRWGARSVSAAQCFYPLLDSRGYAGAALFGVALPILWLAGWLTFLHIFLVIYPEFKWFVAPYPAVLIAVSLAQSARSGIARFVRVAGFVPGKGDLWTGRVVTLLTYAAAPMAVFSTMRWGSLLSIKLGIAAALMGVGLLWLLWKAFTGIASLKGSVRQALIARWLQPLVLGVAAVLALLILPLHFAERSFSAGWRDEAARPVHDAELTRLSEEVMLKWERGE